MEKVLSKFIAPGNKVELQAVARVKTEDPDQQKKTYMTKVYDLLSDDRVEVLMPMEQSKLILLPIDAEYDMYFYTENGLYQCQGRIVDRYKDNNIYVLVVDLVSNLRKRQRREYYRFSCALEMNSRELLKEEIASLEKRGSQLQPGLPLKRSIIVDISGGGLRFVANHSYNKGSVILCKYVLVFEQDGKVSEKEYNLTGRVLDVNEVANRENVFEHRVQYINMDVDEREEIIRYIFNEDRKHRRKERGIR